MKRRAHRQQNIPRQAGTKLARQEALGRDAEYVEPALNVTENEAGAGHGEEKPRIGRGAEELTGLSDERWLAYGQEWRN